MSEQKNKGINLHIYPSTLEGASRITKIAKSVHKALGFKKTHIVGIFSEGLSTTEEITEDVQIIRIKGTSLSGILGKILKVLSWQPKVYRRYRREHISSVAAHNIWVLPLAYRIARVSGAILVYNTHELETEAIAMKGIQRWVAKIVESRYIKKCDIVSVVNEPIAEWYRDSYQMDKPIVVPNVPVDIGPAVDTKALLDIPSSQILYAHTGHVTIGRNIPLILSTFEETPDRHVVFFGDGPLRGLVESAAARCPNIHWHPPVPSDRVVAHLRGADVGLCLIEYVSLSDELSTPNKLMEPLAAGLPVLSTDLVEARRLLGKDNTLWVLEDPAQQLGARVCEIERQDIEAFKAQWGGIPTWDDAVDSLIRAYKDRCS